MNIFHFATPCGHKVDIGALYAFEGVGPLASSTFDIKLRPYRGYSVLKILVPLILVFSFRI